METKEPHKSHHNLTIQGVTKYDLGKYQCEASNDLGETLSKEIQLLDTPASIYDETKVHQDQNMVVVQWLVHSHKPIVETEVRMIIQS